LVLSRDPIRSLSAFVCKVWFADAKRGVAHWAMLPCAQGAVFGRGLFVRRLPIAKMNRLVPRRMNEGLAVLPPF